MSLEINKLISGNRICSETEQRNSESFASVMATGIVSIACWQGNLELIASALFACNLLLFVWLLYLTGKRLILSRGAVLSEVFDLASGVEYFTIVAASCVVGSQFLLILHIPILALILWICSFFVWFLLTYTIFTNLIIKKPKPRITEMINGGWLLAIVAIQSVALLGASLFESKLISTELVLFLSLNLWLCGGMLYIWIISLILHRYAFYPMDAETLTPPYWINMGAMAISTLTGATLISVADESALLSGMLPFLKGGTLLCWATATWWVPLLLVLGCWRHIFNRISVSYDPRFWSIVFPQGMYAAATHRLAVILEISLLNQASILFTLTALAAWLLTVFGKLVSLYRQSRATTVNSN